VRALVRAEIGSGSAETPKEHPNLAQVLTLAAMAIDVTLLYVLLDGQLRLSKSPVITIAQTVMPAIGGAALIAYLDESRRAVVAACRHWQVKIAAFGLVIVLGIVTIVPLSYYVHVPRGATVTVDSLVQMLRPDASLQRLVVHGLGTHHLVVSEHRKLGDVSEEVAIGAIDVLRSMQRAYAGANGEQPSIQLPVLVAPYRFDGSTHLVVTGRFSELYLRSARKHAWVNDSIPERTSVWFPLPPGNGIAKAVQVPAGTWYHFRLYPTPCEGAVIDARLTTERQTLSYDLKCPNAS
jgi:hypothetical protein